MKKINEMTDRELVQTIESLQTIDSKEVRNVIDQLKKEVEKREQEREAKRLEAERRRKEKEMEKRLEAEKAEKTLAEKQKSVIGQYFKRYEYNLSDFQKTIDFTYEYKVLGVYDDKAIVSVVKKYNRWNQYSIYVSFVNIDDLLDDSKYKASCKNDYDTAANHFDNSFDNVVETFKKMFNFGW